MIIWTFERRRLTATIFIIPATLKSDSNGFSRPP